MRAVLCLRPVLAPPSSRSPAAVPVRPSSVRAADEVIYQALADGPDWAGQVQAARAALARLPEPLRLQTAAGLATTPFVAGCAATLALPGALQGIAPGQEAATLAPLPLRLLSGLAAPVHRELQALRVLTLGDLAALPPALLTAVFGPVGQQWQRLARGEDPRLGTPTGMAGGAELRAEMGLPARTGVLRRADLAPLVRELAEELTAAGRAAAMVAVTVRFSGGAPVTRAARLQVPIATAEDLLTAAWPLVEAGLRTRRRRPVALTLAAPQTTVAVVQAPLPLPPPPAARATHLAATVAALQQRFGPQVIGYGRPGRV